ncbi:MAG: DUF1152 domain-containing protein [Solirubrobacterales bacterium]
MLGIGGGGDVVGALASALTFESTAVDTIVGGVSWERLPIDPLAGPRTSAEILDGRELAARVLLAEPQTRTTSGAVFAESHMASFLGRDTLLVDPNGGPAEVADGLEQATKQLDADLVAFVDVGGDVLAAGGEPGLASPLCDAVMLAAADLLQRRGVPCVGAVFGPCCDGELTLAELLDQLAIVCSEGGLIGARALDEAHIERMEAALAVVPTEASAQAIRCARGEIGETTIRRGRRSVPLSPVGAMTFYFDPGKAMASAARLASAVSQANSLEQANGVLRGLGVNTELDYERENAPAPH